MNAPPNPAHIMQIGLGFWASKALLTAVELNLFGTLGDGAMTAPELSQALGLQASQARDLYDALVSLDLLHRDGDGPAATYRNTVETGMFLNPQHPAYIGGFLEMAGARLYPFWGRLSEGLRTGAPQNEARDGGDLFETLYADEARLEQFMRAMAAIQAGNFMALAQAFDWSAHRTVCDVGGANGALSVALATAHPHLRCVTWDLPAVAPVAARNVEAAGLADRVQCQSGDFFADPLPAADVITMGNILHDWDADTKKRLMKSAHDALPPGGALIVIEMVIDDARRENTMGLLMSLNMLIETGTGFDCTAADLGAWGREVGFTAHHVLPLTGPTSAVVLRK